MPFTQFNYLQSYKIVSTYGFICKSLGFSCNHLESLQLDSDCKFPPLFEEYELFSCNFNS